MLRVTKENQVVNKYERELPQLVLARGTIDVYDIDEMFPMANTAFIHARKKLFNAGNRSGGKSLIQDIEEAIESLRAGIIIEKDKYPQSINESPAKTGDELVGLMCHLRYNSGRGWSDESVRITEYREGYLYPYVTGSDVYMDAKEAKGGINE